MSYFKVFFLSFFFIVNVLWANDVAYKFSLSNETPYEKEALLLEVNLTQIDHAKVMLFKFSLKQSKDYVFHQVAFKENEKYHDLQHQYKYLIYPMKSGSISLEFEMIKSLTDDDKVAYSISGDRDNVKGLQKKDIIVKLKPLVLEVKALPLGIDLVGDFTLEHTLDRTKTEAFNPINLKVKLKGMGFLSSFELLKKSDNYTLFTQKPNFKTIHTELGSDSFLEWDYAISAKESYVLPKVFLKAFNPRSEKVYDLNFPDYTVEVNQVDVSSLLDKEDYPLRSKGINWDFWSWFFSYVVVFVAGALMPRGLFKRKKVLEKSSEDILTDNIKEAKTHKALLKVLLLEDNHNFKEAIADLESVVYNAQNISLAKIKSLLRK